MATKWHPASGKWGPFGETSGSKSASRARGQIGTALADLEDLKVFKTKAATIFAGVQVIIAMGYAALEMM